MQHVRAVLRRAAAERRMKGDENARDTAIEMFLDELGALFTPYMIESIDDTTVAEMYEDWVRALKELDRSQRIEALVQQTQLCKVPFLIHRKGKKIGASQERAAPESSGNVVSLYAR